MAPTDTGAPWWSSRRTLLAAALMVVVLVMALVLVFTRNRQAPGVAVPGPTGAPHPTAASGSSSTAASANFDDQIPRTTPPPVSWVVFQQIALPVSATAGPRQVDGDVAYGFAHTPTGALLAASQISIRYMLANDWRAVAARSVAPGPGRDVWVATRSKYGSLEPPAPGTFCQSAGYRFIDAVPDRAVIETASRCPNGQIQATTSTVTWQDGDWKLVLQPDGSSGPPDHIITSLEGFAPWGGI